jgi:TPR repeat protein
LGGALLIAAIGAYAMARTFTYNRFSDFVPQFLKQFDRGAVRAKSAAAGEAFPNNTPASRTLPRDTAALTRTSQLAAMQSPATQPKAGERLGGRVPAAIAATAQFDLAVHYAEASSGERNYELAAQWYGKAAEQGLAVAEYRLASLYEKGLGVGRDMQRAKNLYQRAAEKGNTRAMHNLGVLAVESTDGRPNCERGVMVWRGGRTWHS